MLVSPRKLWKDPRVKYKSIFVLKMKGVLHPNYENWFYNTPNLMYKYRTI